MTTDTKTSGLTDTELIERVAREIMGWQQVRIDERELCWAPEVGLPIGRVGNWNPLTDWGHTMQVVERLTDQQVYVSFDMPVPSHNMDATVEVRGCGYNPERDKKFRDVYMTHADPKRALCLAALSALSPQHP